MERQKFEDSFRDAFQHAEISPADNVWTNIELDLERQAGDKMKRRVLFFKWVAAASVAFAMAAGGVGYYVSQGNNSFGNNAGIVNNEGVNDVGTTHNNSISIQDEKNSNDVSLEQSGAVVNKSNFDELTASKESSSLDASNKQKNVQNAGLNSEKQTALEESSSLIDGSKKQRNVATVDNNSSKSNLSILDEQLIADKTTQNENKSLSKESTATKNVTDHPAVESYTSNNKDSNDNDLETIISIGKNVTKESDHTYKSRVLTNSNDGTSFEADISAGTISREREEAILKSKNLRSGLVEKQEVVLVIPQPEQSGLNEGELLLLELALLDEKNSKEKPSKSERIWTSVGFAAGSFSNTSFGASDAGTVNSPSFSSSSIKADALLNYAQSSGKTNSSVNSGVAYSIGVNVGGRISEHWILQGGLNYITRQSDYTSDAVVTVDNRSYEASSYLNNSADMKSGDVLNTLEAESFSYTEQFQVNNTMQLISFPMQAGYILVNKKVNVQVNGGIATDLFIKNTISANEGGLSDITNHREEESPFRPLNFSGLVGTEVSYKFSDHYRLSINPGIRYPFNSIYKSETQLSVNPITFDVGLRFLYIFR